MANLNSANNDKVNNVNSPCQGGVTEGDGGYIKPRNVNLEALAPFINFHYNKKNNERAKSMSHAMTKHEQILWFNILKSRQLAGYKFVKQKQVFNYIVDFYCSELLLAIEVDGGSHNDRVDYDKQRDDFLRSCGLGIIRITNDDIEHNLSGVYDMLMKAVSK